MMIHAARRRGVSEYCRISNLDLLRFLGVQMEAFSHLYHTIVGSTADVLSYDASYNVVLVIRKESGQRCGCCLLT